MPLIEVLVGMIASGKSTYARTRADAGALVVAHDGLTEMLHARYRYEPGKRDLYRTLEESLVWGILAKGFDVVVDRTHLTLESRQRWVMYGKGLNVPVVAVVFPAKDAEVHARRRYTCDPRGRTYEDWLAVARHHAAQAAAEPLDWRAEGFREFEAKGGAGA